MPTKPVTVIVPHQLGKAEARNRLQRGMTQLPSQLLGMGTVAESQWTEDRMNFRMGILNQTITGRIDVLDDAVRIEVDLPWVLAMLAEKMKTHIGQKTGLLLTKK